MAVYKIFPTKDTTLYSLYPPMNTGLDEIIEATTTTVGVNDDSFDPQTSRFLVKFSDSEINGILNNKVPTGASFETYLRIFQAKITGLNLTSSLKINPISGSWEMGTGQFTNTPTSSNGTSWEYQDYSGSVKWPSSGFNAYVTASYTGSNTGGGTWYTGSTTSFDVNPSQSFDYYSDLDINTKVTDIIHLWYSQSIVNEGFIVRQPESDEFVMNSAKEAEFKFFSRDTHTIYPPQLEFRWYDYSFDTGSSQNNIIRTSEMIAVSPNNLGNFYSESIQRFRINVRPKYPPRVFQTSSIYTTNYYLPESQSLYAIKDLDTNEYVINFDPIYTRISADFSSSYFDIYMNGLEPERYYTVLIQTVIDNTTLVLDENINFKVIQG